MTNILKIYEHLTQANVQALVSANLQMDAATFALKHKDAIAASQIKCLQKAITKLPSFYAVKAILPELAFEQCSSELAAQAKNIGGGTCLDLTAGLGVDTCHFAKHFDSVTAVEQDEGLIKVLKHNLGLLQIQHVNVIHTDASSFLEKYEGTPFDWVYVDPARRSASGGKLYLPKHCSPDVVTLFPMLQKVAKNILIKLSPMYDIDAAVREFTSISVCVVLSIHDECKEMLLYFSEQKEPTMIIARCLHEGKFIDFVGDKVQSTIPVKHTPLETPKYIYEPDVAIYKCRMLEEYMQKYYPCISGQLTAVDGYWLSEVLQPEFCGRIFEVQESWVYQPRRIGEYLKKHNITRLNVVRRNSRDTAADIRKALKVKEGGADYLVVTSIDGRQMAWMCKRLSC